MRAVRIVGIAIVLMISSKGIIAQQEAMNAQFVTNTMAFNPGYAGYKMRQAIIVDHRNQWVGFKGAPTTTNVSFDIASKRHRGMSYGGNIMHDKIGPTSELALQGIVAYGFRVNAKSRVNVGLRSELAMFQANFTGLDLTSEVFNIQDINFSYNPSKVLLANFGVGAFYDTEDYFIGLSTPRMMKNKLDGKNPDLDIYNSVRGKSQPTYYLMGGYNWKMNAQMELQPTVLARATFGAPMSLGLYTTLILKKKMKIGAFYNYKEVAGGLIYFHINKKTEIGYSFDVATNELIRTNFGSHEVTLAYNFRSVTRKIVYPRRF